MELIHRNLLFFLVFILFIYLKCTDLINLHHIRLLRKCLRESTSARRSSLWTALLLERAAKSRTIVEQHVQCFWSKSFHKVRLTKKERMARSIRLMAFLPEEALRSELRFMVLICEHMSSSGSSWLKITCLAWISMSTSLGNLTFTGSVHAQA